MGCFNPTDTSGTGDDSGSTSNDATSMSGSMSTVGSESMTASTASTTMTADDSSTGSESAGPGTDPTTQGPGTDSGTDDGTTGPTVACGDGLFSEDAPPLGNAELVATLTNAFAVTIVDADDDGISDLFVGDLGDANTTVAGVYFVRGTGGGAFAAPVKLPGGAFVTFAVAAGAISDDAVDIAAMGAFPTGPKDFVSTVYVWRGNGDGTFAAPTSIIGASTQDVALFNLDDNRRLDLIGSGGSGAAVSLSSAAEAFDDTEVYGGIAAQEAVAGTDLDGDGDGDIVYLTTTGVAVLLGDGTGAFADATVFDLELNGPADIAVGDFDGDGNGDVAAGMADSVFVLPGNGDGELGEAVEAIAGSAINAIAATDFDGDGCTDLAATEPSFATVVTRMGRDGLAFVESTPFAIAATGAPADVAAGDLDGDEIADLAVVVSNGNAAAGGEVLVLLSGG